MTSPTRLPLVLAAFAILWSGRVDGVTPSTTAVGVYDETVHDP
jgi:hypothetical protein